MVGGLSEGNLNRYLRTVPGRLTDAIWHLRYDFIYPRGDLQHLYHLSTASPENQQKLSQYDTRLPQIPFPERFGNEAEPTLIRGRANAVPTLIQEFSHSDSVGVARVFNWGCTARGPSYAMTIYRFGKIFQNLKLTCGSSGYL